MITTGSFRKVEGELSAQAKLELKLYLSMFRLRAVEEAIAERYSEQKMRCPTHLSVGQEAVSAAISLLLDKSDLCVSGHRAHTHYLAKGGSLDAMIAEIHGKATGCSGGLGGSMHLIDESVGFKGSTAIVGGTIPVGVGLGLSLKLKKQDNISVIFLGDGAVEEGAFYEAANFAVLKNLPVLFVCENNFFSVYSPLSVRQPEDREINKMASAIGLESFSGNGYDALESYSSLKSACEFVRSGQGPAFIELETFRWREHCGPNYDNSLGYRTEEEFEAWKAKDPVSTLRAKLDNESYVPAEILEECLDEIRSEVSSAFDKAYEAPFPSESVLEGSVYAPN